MSQILAGCCCTVDDGSGGCVCGKTPLTAYVVNYTADFSISTDITTRPGECLPSGQPIPLSRNCGRVTVSGSIPITTAYGDPVDPSSCMGNKVCDGFVSFRPNVGSYPQVISCEDGLPYYKVPAFGHNIGRLAEAESRSGMCPRESDNYTVNVQDKAVFGIVCVSAALGCPTPGFGSAHELRIDFVGLPLDVDGDALTDQCFAPLRPTHPGTAPNNQPCPDWPPYPFPYFVHGAGTPMLQQQASMNNPRGTYSMVFGDCSFFPVGLGRGIILESLTASVA